ncbi:MAG: hypothetical protein ABSE44_18295 [Candidatus Sulfotelmatobacter sp.]|jgi:hypothetical protein
MRSILSARLPKQKEIRKQDQIGILAQNILLCGKLRAGIFPRMIIQYPHEEFVKWRDGNCRGDGAGRGSAKILLMSS